MNKQYRRNIETYIMFDILHYINITMKNVSNKSFRSGVLRLFKTWDHIHHLCQHNLLKSYDILLKMLFYFLFCMCVKLEENIWNYEEWSDRRVKKNPQPWHALPRYEMGTNFWLESLKKRHHSKDRRKWEDNIKMHFRETGCGREWMKFIWLRIGLSGGLLWTR
jgi:hypothetical protein